MGAVAQRAQAGEMVGMQMRIHRLDQLEVELADELDVTVDLLQHRIDDQRLAPAPAGDEVGVSAGHAVEELAKNHPGDSPIQGLRIPSGSREQYKSSLPVPKGRRRRYSLEIICRIVAATAMAGTTAARPWSAPCFKLWVRSADRRAIPIPTMNRRKAPWALCRARRARAKGSRRSPRSRNW